MTLFQQTMASFTYTMQPIMNPELYALNPLVSLGLSILMSDCSLLIQQLQITFLLTNLACASAIFRLFSSSIRSSSSRFARSSS